MKIQKISTLILFVSIIIFTYSCSSSNDVDDVPANGTIEIKATSSINNITSKSIEKSKSNFTVNVTTFKVNIKNVELGIQDGTYADFFVEGPYFLNLSDATETIDISTITVPNNVYDKVKFNLHQELNNTNGMFEKSVIIEGDIDGIPFEFWHNTENLVEVELNNAAVLNINGNDNTVIINFDLDTLFYLVENYGFNGANPEDTDRNDNGIIEINPNNDDENGNVAELFLELIQGNIVIN